MKTIRRYVSGPLIARLRMCHRMRANALMRAGRYGPTFFRGRIRYADLAAVETAHGLQFTADQIERAAEGLPGRVIAVAETQEMN